MSDLPLYFAIKRYRPNIEEEYPSLEPYKNLGVLIQSTKNQNGSWSLEMVNNPSILIEDASTSVSNADRWFNNRIDEFQVCKYNSTTTIPLRIKFNYTIIVNTDFTIPLLKISDPCNVLSKAFYDLPNNLDYGFELNNAIQRETQTIPKFLETKPQEIKIPSHIMSAYIQSLLDKKEVCPITMEPLEQDTLYVTTCGHAMNKGAAERWITQKKTCPVCRVACSFCD
jgi:hypothetical protein